MKTIHLENDIMLFCITADAFPDSVPHAWYQLYKLLDGTTCCAIYGVSFKNEMGVLMYKASVEATLAGEANGCKMFQIPKGDYPTETIMDFPKQLHLISRTFQTLLAHPDRATDAVCVEGYKNNDDLVCMMK
jgi:hypothetical protein